MFGSFLLFFLLLLIFLFLLLFLLLFLSLLFFSLSVLLESEYRPHTCKELLSNIPPQSKYFLEMIITEPFLS